MEPLVSVAIATYNGQLYLREQLDSIYNQTYKNLEVIVCDDCSEDGTLDILEEYKQQFGLIYCVNETRLGFVKNFERAIKNCRGDYIALCDQDDVWLPEKLETLLGHINEKSLICSDLILVDKNKNLIDNSLYNHTGLQFYNSDQFKYLVHSNFVVGCTTLFKHELKYIILPFPEGIPYHDWWIALIASANGGIEFCSKPLVYYRYHGNNNTQTGKKTLVISVVDKINEVNKKLNSDFYISKCNWLKNICMSRYFSPSQIAYINEITEIYNGIISKKIPIKATILAFKNRKYMFPRRGPVKQVIFTLGIIFAGIIRFMHIPAVKISFKRKNIFQGDLTR